MSAVTSSNITVARNSLWLIAGPLVVSLVSVFVTAWVARYLGTEGYGLLLLLMAYVAFFAPFVGLGLRPYTVREIASNRSRAREIVESMLGLRLGFAIIAVLPIVIGYPVFFEADRYDLTLIVLVVGQVVVNAMATCFLDALHGIENMKAAAATMMLSGFVVQFGLILAVLFRQDIYAFALVYLLGSVTLLVVAAVQAVRFIGRPRIGLGHRIRFEQLRHGWQFFLPGLFEMVRQRFAYFLINHFLGSHAVGLFGAAHGLTQKFDVIQDGIASASFPRAAALHASSPEELKALVQDTFKVLLLISMPLMCGLLYVSDEVVELLYGHDYRSAGAVLAVLGASVPFVYLCGFLWSLLGALHQQRKLLYISLVSTLLGLGLLVLGMVRAGLLGAALAFLTTHVMLTAFVAAAYAYKMGAPFRWFDLGRIALANGMMAAVLWPLSDTHLAIQVVAGALVYAVGVFALRLIKPSEIRAVLGRRTALEPI